MTIIVNNFKKDGQHQVFNVKGFYKKWNKTDKPSALCTIPEYSDQSFNISGIQDGVELIISKVGSIGLFKTTDFKILK